MEILDFWARSLQQDDEGAMPTRVSRRQCSAPEEQAACLTQRRLFTNGYATNPDPTFHFFPSPGCVFMLKLTCGNYESGETSHYSLPTTPWQGNGVWALRHPFACQIGKRSEPFLCSGISFFLPSHPTTLFCSSLLITASYNFRVCGTEWQSANGCYNIWTFRKNWLLS